MARWGDIAMEPLKKSTHLRGEDRRRYGQWLRARYEEGAGIAQLAAHTGRSYGAVHALLLESGTTLRPPGGSASRPTSPLPPARTRQASGEKPLMTAREAAATLGVPATTIYRLIDAGLITCVPAGRSYRLHRASVEQLRAQPDHAAPGNPDPKIPPAP